MIFTRVTFLNEGEQAEEYKKRKAEEAAHKEKEEKERNERRYGGLEKDKHTQFVGNKMNMRAFRKADLDKMSEEEYDKYYDTHAEDEHRANAAARMANKTGAHGDDFNKAFDAANKHMRRHPEKYKHESSIFESVSFLNETNSDNNE